VGLGLAARVDVMLWDRALRRLQKEQEKILSRILRRNADTEFGRAHRFSEVRGYDDFRRAVPVGDYDAFSPFIERMRAGETDVLVRGRVPYYGNSSGSSNEGRAKFLPITERQIAHQRRAGADTLLRYLAWSKDKDFLTGFTLGLFPPINMKEDRGALVTMNPSLMVTRLPRFTKPAYLPHEDVLRIEDYGEKLQVVAERYMDWDVRAVTGTTCWFLLLFEKVLETAKRRGRSARTVREIWPNLKVLLGGGVAAAPYVPLMKRLVGRDDLTLVDTYNATEGGIYATSDFTGRPGMLMLPHRGTFFELVEVDERGRGARVPLWEARTDKTYAIVVTTESGLYAYELGDLVRFPSIDPPRIEFAGRLSGCLSLTQELTTHVEIEKAMEFANAELGSRTVEFAAAGEIGSADGVKPRYVLFVELDEGTSVRADALAAAFDRGLCQQNRVYRQHRERDVALAPPTVVKLPRGASKRFLDDVTRGNVQGKFPRILDDARAARLRGYASAQERA
jgi:hypothetical protein